MTKLRPNQARKIAKAEADYSSAKRELEEAKATRDKVREQYADRVPIGDVVVAGGIVIKRRTQSTGKRFSLGAFLKSHRLTKAMKPFVSEGSYEVWDVRPDG
jgi:hypothetical protein